MFEKPFEEIVDSEKNFLGSLAQHKRKGDEKKRRESINLEAPAAGHSIKWNALKDATIKKCKFTETNDPRVVVMPMLGKYHINEYGQLMKEDEIDIHFECKFQPSKDMNMRLQLSHDRTRIVLPTVHNNKDKTSITLMAWKTHSLEPVKLDTPIKRALQNLPKGKLIDANFVGLNEHIMITLKRESIGPHRS